MLPSFSNSRAGSSRYLGLALAIWLFGISLAYIIRPTLKIGCMPFSLLIVSLFSIYAGPFGAFGWSERAQVERTRSLASELDAFANGVLVPTQNPQDATTTEAFQSALRYVFENFGAEPLEAELAGFHKDKANLDFGSSRGYYMTNQVMTYLELSDDLENASTHFYANRMVLPTHGHAWMIDYHFYAHRSNNTSGNYTLGATELSFLTNHEANTLTIQTKDSQIVQIDLALWAADVKETVKTHGSRDIEPFVWNVEGNNWRFSFVCTNGNLKSDDTFQSANFRVFLTPPS